jgi:uncharacterized protein
MSPYAMPSLASRARLPVEPDAVSARRFTLAGRQVAATHDGGLLLDGGRVLVVSDLHFEKGSSLAMRGALLPPYDTAETLARLARLMARVKPQLVVALGDSFHDTTAGRRIAPDDRAGLIAMANACDMVWIEGNHDPEAPDWLPGDRRATLVIDSLTLQHEPAPAPAGGEICGHLHPCARVAGRTGVARRRCFATDGQRLVMPAFGAFTGGLNLLDAAFAGLWSGAPTAMVMGHNRVHAVATSQLVPD